MQMMERKDGLVLKWMLGQVRRARKRLKQLDNRLMQIYAERNAPIGGVGYDPLPRGNSVGNGSATIVFKCAEVEERIYAQRAEIENAIVRVMDILDALPIDSVEREVCELYYLDGKDIPQVEEEACLSRTHCYNKLKSALEYLLVSPRVIEMVEANTEAYDMWCIQRDSAMEKRKGGNR